MDIHKSFHMNGGTGDKSYSKNSSLQKRVAERVKHITIETIEQVFISKKPKSIGIADLGCSSGPNTLSNIKNVVDAVDNASRRVGQPPPECRVYLNDLPTNDFNTIFQALPDLYKDLKRGDGTNDQPPLYVGAYPGTFYGRLFPDECLHFVYSATCLHWLSTVPRGIFDKAGRSKNLKSIYISERSPPDVIEAYSKQFQEDFSLFLKSRSKELIPGGRMLLTLLGRIASDHAHCANSILWELLYQSLAHLVAQGEIAEENLESYEVHFYAPSKAETVEQVRKEGSFKVEMAEMFEMELRELRDGGVEGGEIHSRINVVSPLWGGNLGQSLPPLCIVDRSRVRQTQRYFRHRCPCPHKIVNQLFKFPNVGHAYICMRPYSYRSRTSRILGPKVRP